MSFRSQLVINLNRSHEKMSLGDNGPYVEPFRHGALFRTQLF